MRFLALVLVLGALSASEARAADCTDEPDQASMNRCADDALQKSDAELNKLYKEITQQLKGDAATLKLLVAAERAWVNFRDAECTFATADWAGGSAYSMYYAICAEELTRKRISELKVYRKCDDGEGEENCPAQGQ